MSKQKWTSSMETSWDSTVEYTLKKGDFSWALKLLKKNKRVTRGDGWFLELQRRSPLSKMTEDYIYINQDGKMVAWTPTQSDMLAEDWKEINDQVC